MKFLIEVDGGKLYKCEDCGEVVFVSSEENDKNNHICSFIEKSKEDRIKSIKEDISTANDEIRKHRNNIVELEKFILKCERVLEKIKW